jgi:hypothetical protein
VNNGLSNGDIGGSGICTGQEVVLLSAEKCN